MNRFFGRTLLSSLLISSLVAFAGVAHAEGGAGGEAGAAGAAAGAAGADAGGAGGAAAGAGGAAAGAGGAAAGAGGAAAGAGGGTATTCVGADETTFKPLTSCADATTGAPAFFCNTGACTAKGESCKVIYESCAADAGCAKAVYCGGLCAAGEDSVANCAKFAGAGITLALKVKACQEEAASQAMKNPPSACVTGGAGAGGSGTGGSGTGGSVTGSAGTAGAGTAGAGTAGAGTAGAGAGGSKAATPAAPAEEDDGCGCSVPGASHSSQAAGLVGLGLLALGLRRRRNAKLGRTCSLVDRHRRPQAVVRRLPGS